jgi:hypothetical protein
MILETIQEILSQTGNLSESNGNALAHIRGSYADFLHLYKEYLFQNKPKHINSKEQKDRYKRDMQHKLSLMISHLRNVLSVLSNIRQTTKISPNIIDRLDLVKHEIGGFLDEIKSKYEETFTPPKI